MNNERCEVFDIIITLAKSFNTPDTNGNPHVISKYNNEEKYLWNCKYLLNQVLRNYNVDPSRYHITKAADELWKKITTKNIKDFYYREKVECEFDNNVEIHEYKGGSKKTYNKRTIKKGDSFIFKDVFHLEHVIPINVIMEKILDLNKSGNLNYESLDKVLEGIHVCRMLKDEDRKINSKYKSKRPNSFDEVVEKIYKEAGIEIRDN